MGICSSGFRIDQIVSSSIKGLESEAFNQTRAVLYGALAVGISTADTYLASS